MLPIQSIPAWKAIISIFHIVALSSTVLRIFDRFYMSRMWWDDYLAFLPLITDSMFFVIIWKGYGDRFRDAPSETFYGFFLSTVLHYTTIWSSRIILALGLARLFPSWCRTRAIALSLAAVFCLVYILALSTTTATCKSPGLPFYRMTGAECIRGVHGVPVSGVISITCDFLADISLVIFSFLVLWHIKLPKHQRRLILTTVSASMLTLMSVTLFCVLWYGEFNIGPDARLLNMMATHLEDTTSLIVANLLIVVTLIYRLIRKYEAMRHRSTSNQNQAVPETPSPRNDTDNGAVTSRKTETDRQQDIHSSRDQLTAITWTDIESDLSHMTGSRNRADLAESKMGSEYLDVDSRWAETDDRQYRSGHFR